MTQQTLLRCTTAKQGMWTYHSPAITCWKGSIEPPAAQQRYKARKERTEMYSRYRSLPRSSYTVNYDARPAKRFSALSVSPSKALPVPASTRSGPISTLALKAPQGKCLPMPAKMNSTKTAAHSRRPAKEKPYSQSIVLRNMLWKNWCECLH